MAKNSDAQKQIHTSLDDLVWWKYAPMLTKLYSHITRITIEEAKYATVLDALNQLESLGEPFDVYILSHGMPNYLSDGEGYFMSFREIDALQGKFPHMNLVLMQSCYGSSLSEDWHQAGAKTVISFPDLNRNFFWVSFFLKNYENHDIPNAYRMTNQGIEEDISEDFLYKNLLKDLNLTPEEYVKDSPNPDYSTW